MTPAWSRRREGGLAWQLDQGRSLEVYFRNTGWCVRLKERSEVVKMSWPFSHCIDAQAKAESLAVELGWLSELPRR